MDRGLSLENHPEPAIGKGAITSRMKFGLTPDSGDSKWVIHYNTFSPIKSTSSNAKQIFTLRSI